MTDEKSYGGLKEACTHCGSKEVKYLMTSKENGRNMYRCMECRKFFFVKLKAL